MKRLLIASLYALIVAGFGVAIGQNINRSVQLSQSALGPVGADNLGTIWLPVHLNVSGSAPVIAAFGTGAAAVGSDIAGNIQVGTSPGTQGFINWRTAYTSTPFCTVSPSMNTASISSAVGILATPSGAVVHHSLTAGGSFNYICFGRATG